MERIPVIPIWIALSSVTCLGLLVAGLGLVLILASRYKLAGIGISVLGLLMSAAMLAVIFFAPLWN